MTKQGPSILKAMVRNVELTSLCRRVDNMKSTRGTDISRQFTANIGNGKPEGGENGKAVKVACCEGLLRTLAGDSPHAGWKGSAFFV